MKAIMFNKKRGTDHIETLDGDVEVWVLLVGGDDGGREHVAGTLDVDAWVVHGLELDSLEVTHAPEQNLESGGELAYVTRTYR